MWECPFPIAFWTLVASISVVLGKGFYGFTLCFVKDVCVIPSEATFSCSPSNFFVFEHLVQLYLT